MVHLVETVKFVHGGVTVTRDRSPVAKLQLVPRQGIRGGTKRDACSWLAIGATSPRRPPRALRARNPQSSTGVGMASTSRGAILQGLEGRGGRARREFGVPNRNSSDTVAIRKIDLEDSEWFSRHPNTGMLRLEIGRDE